jgi:hypothetical protein
VPGNDDSMRKLPSARLIRGIDLTEIYIPRLIGEPPAENTMRHVINRTIFLLLARLCFAIGGEGGNAASGRGYGRRRAL